MYEIFEHTADVGIRVRAESLDDLFVDAAQGLFSVIVENPDSVQPDQELAFQVRGEDVEELLHDWLTELLFTFHVRRFVLTDFHVRAEPPELRGIARGEPIDTARHKLDAEVKAITWHQLKVQRQPDGWLAEVIVDI
jgi:SHS2 domain-containing protein